MKLTLSFDFNMEDGKDGKKLADVLSAVSSFLAADSAPDAAETTPARTVKASKKAADTKAVEKVPEPVKETPEVESEDPEEVDEPVAPVAPASEKGPKLTLVDIRAKGVALSKAGKHEKVVEVIKKYGGEKLTDLKEEDYADFLNDLEKIK